MTIAAHASNGNSQSKAANTTLSVLISGGTIPVGAIVFATMGKDNLATGADGDYSEITVSDDAGNTWTKVAEFANTQAGAGAGAVVCLWKCKVTVALTNVTKNVIFTYGSVTAKAAMYQAFTVAAGNDIRLVGAVTKTATDGAAVPNQTIGSLPSKEYLAIRVGGLESGASGMTGFQTGEIQFASGFATTSGGSGITNMAVIGTYKIATATTFTLSGAPSGYAGDSAAMLAIFEEYTPSGPANVQGNFLQLFR